MLFSTQTDSFRGGLKKSESVRVSIYIDIKRGFEGRGVSIVKRGVKSIILEQPLIPLKKYQGRPY